MILTGPEKFKEDLPSKAEEIIEKIEKELKNETDLVFQDRVEIVIDGEYSNRDREEAVRKYISVGWSSVAHRTSSENGERSGLTRFKLYF